MGELKNWIDKVFPNKLAEPNSKLGAGVKYMQKHWKGLTAFLRHPGAPLDNNILEQQLRVPVLNRKNFLFFKSEYGACRGRFPKGPFWPVSRSYGPGMSANV
jgi:hypothetical protein